MNSNVVRFMIGGAIIVIIITGGGIILGISGRDNGTNNADDVLSLSSSKEISLSQVNNHNKPTDCWVYLSGTVYNATPVIAANKQYSRQLASTCGGDGADLYTVQKYTKQDIPAADINMFNAKLKENEIGILAPN